MSNYSRLPHTGTTNPILTLALRPSTNNWYSPVLCSDSSVGIMLEWSADNRVPAIHESQGEQILDRHKVHDRTVFPYPA